MSNGILPKKKKHMKQRWDERLSNILASTSKEELNAIWDTVNPESRKKVGPKIDEYLKHLEVMMAVPIDLCNPPKFTFNNNISDPQTFGGLFFCLI